MFGRLRVSWRRAASSFTREQEIHLRLILYRAWWSGALFSAGIVGISAAILLPHSLRGLPVVLVAVPALVISMLIQSTLPLILVFRRSKVDGPEALLADVFLPYASLYGRSVWFENPGDQLVRDQLQRCTPSAHVVQLMAVAYLAISVLRVSNLGTMLLVLLGALVGSTWLLDASVGNPKTRAVAFIVAGSGAGPIPTSLPSAKESLRALLVFAGLYLAAYLAWSAIHFLSSAEWSPVNGSVRTLFDRMWLLIEMYVPICFGTRFIHGGPAVLRSLKSSQGAWQDTVLLLMRRTRYAIMDISTIEDGSALAWELQECYSKKIKLLLTCPTNQRSSATECVRRLLPRAVVLPDDFSDLKRLRLLGESEVQYVQIFTYAEKGSFEPFIAQSRVFFGEVSLSEWYSAIAMSRKRDSISGLTAT